MQKSHSHLNECKKDKMQQPFVTKSGESSYTGDTFQNNKSRTLQDHSKSHTKQRKT